MKAPCPTKIAICSVIVALFLSVGCSKDDTAVSYDLAGNWKVVYYIDGSETITKTDENTWPDINNGDVTANFTEPDDGGEGAISGITVTNAYQGNYTLGAEGEITIGPVATTFINEPEWTNLFRISGAQNYEVKNSRLFIYYNDGQNAIVLERN